MAISFSRAVASVKKHVSECRTIEESEKDGYGQVRFLPFVHE